jgi:hypothetical protein
MAFKKPPHPERDPEHSEGEQSKDATLAIQVSSDKFRGCDGGYLTSRRLVLVAVLAALTFAAMPALAVDREKGVKGPHVDGVPDFVDIQPIILPVIERDAVTRQVGIVVTLELAQGEHPDVVEPKRRQLTDAFIRELHTLYAWRSSSNRVVDEQLIKRRLLLVADDVIGQGIVHAILVRQLLEQAR